NELEGNIDEVRIWNVERSQLQIRLNMHLTLLGVESGLIAYYQFNDDQPAGTPLGVKDVLNSKNGTTQGHSTYVLSQVAVAQGISHSININDPGNYTFGDTGLDIGFGAAPFGDVVVSTLLDLPYNTPESETEIEHKYWIVNNYGALNESLAAIVTCHFSDTAFLMNQESLYTLHKRASTDFGAWESTITPATLISNVTGHKYLTFSGVDEFSQLFPTLPTVSLQHNTWIFEAQNQNTDSCLLSWKSPLEEDLQYFELERGASPQGLERFIQVGTQHSYQLSELKQSSYYRVKQVHLDGRVSWSPILYLEAKGDQATFDIVVYPNPFIEQLTIRSDANSGSDKFYVDLINQQGFKLFERAGEDLAQLNQGLNDFIPHLPSGSYILRFRRGGFKQYKKIIKR
ncbi:MAG: T9SS type A sorting domain-containing protein, partial [Bacteroidota bacterium]